MFPSHATPDGAEAHGIRDKIIAASHRMFLAPKELQPGDDFAEEIRLALLGSRELWLLVSPSSSKSEWVNFRLPGGSVFVCHFETLSGFSCPTCSPRPLVFTRGGC